MLPGDRESAFDHHSLNIRRYMVNGVSNVKNGKQDFEWGSRVYTFTFQPAGPGSALPSARVGKKSAFESARYACSLALLNH